MGAELKCTARFGGRSAAGTARLESGVLLFRGGDLRLSIPFKAMTKITALDGTLRITSTEGTASFDLGAAAPGWAARIGNPRSRLDKLGAKPEWRASALGVTDRAFLKELKRAVTLLSIGRVARASDAIFFEVTRAGQLTRIARLKKALKPNGAIWVIRPKGRPEISESAVMAAGKAAGLVDVKVVSFSPTHTAGKFVIPLALR